MSISVNITGPNVRHSSNITEIDVKSNGGNVNIEGGPNFTVHLSWIGFSDIISKKDSLS